MHALKLTPEALEGYLPHRGVNILPDEVDLADDGMSATSLTTIEEGDPRGRDLFARRDAEGRSCWYEPFIGELLALTGVPLLRPKLEPHGQVAVFSTISRMQVGPMVPMAGPVTGIAEITRDRSDFTQFACRIRRGEEVSYHAEILSGAATLDEIAGEPVRPLAEPDAGEPVDPAAYDWKHPAMRFVDRVREWDPDAGRLVASYTYPEDHPLIPGHFPGAPLMMGMAQWAAVADAAWEAIRRASGEGTWKVQGGIAREDGSSVVGVRDLLIEIDGGAPRIAATKRLAFRDVVRPGDGLLIEAQVTRC